jgi:hypothetical protein
MIWILGLFTGIVFDMPAWWWAFGFLMALLDS